MYEIIPEDIPTYQISKSLDILQIFPFNPTLLYATFFRISADSFKLFRTTFVYFTLIFSYSKYPNIIFNSLKIAGTIISDDRRSELNLPF